MDRQEGTLLTGTLLTPCFPLPACGTQLGGIVAKKWDPGILDPVPFSGQIRKVEARLGKLAKIRKVETD